MTDVPATRRGYFRFPALHGDTVAFVAEGDLWRVPVSGGAAIRLTSHPGDKAYPAFSPDGSMLAFTATYEGPAEVYVMPASGGLPTRLTYDGSYAAVSGWSPAGELVYSTSVHSTLPAQQLHAIDPETRRKRSIPLAEAARGVYLPDGVSLCFTRRPFQGSHTRGYRGGTVQNLWLFREGADEAMPLTADYAGTSKDPMVWGDRILFLSDRSGAMNLWSMNADGGDLRQHTHHDDWEVRSASAHGDRVVYRLGADLHLHDLTSGETSLLDITLASDFDPLREVWVKRPIDYLTHVALSPAGDRVALTARGQVFVAPVKPGRLVEVTRRRDVRYRQARFMPDGRHLLALSDATAEVEIERIAADGLGPAETLTKGATTLRWDALPSPDGRYVAHHSKSRELLDPRS